MVGFMMPVTREREMGALISFILLLLYIFNDLRGIAVQMIR